MPRTKKKDGAPGWLAAAQDRLDVEEKASKSDRRATKARQAAAKLERQAREKADAPMMSRSVSMPAIGKRNGPARTPSDLASRLDAMTSTSAPRSGSGSPPKTSVSAAIAAARATDAAKTTEELAARIDKMTGRTRRAEKKERELRSTSAPSRSPPKKTKPAVKKEDEFAVNCSDVDIFDLIMPAEAELDAARAAIDAIESRESRYSSGCKAPPTRPPTEAEVEAAEAALEAQSKAARENAKASDVDDNDDPVRMAAIERRLDAHLATSVSSRMANIAAASRLRGKTYKTRAFKSAQSRIHARELTFELTQFEEDVDSDDDEHDDNDGAGSPARIAPAPDFDTAAVRSARVESLVGDFRADCEKVMAKIRTKRAEASAKLDRHRAAGAAETKES